MAAESDDVRGGSATVSPTALHKRVEGRWHVGPECTACEDLHLALDAARAEGVAEGAEEGTAYAAGFHEAKIQVEQIALRVVEQARAEGAKQQRERDARIVSGFQMAGDAWTQKVVDTLRTSIKFAIEADRG